MPQLNRTEERIEMESGLPQGSYGQSIEDWAERLQSMLRELSRIIPDRESEFLRIGQGIWELSGRSREIAEMAKDLARKAAGEAVKDGLEDLSGVLGDMEETSEGGSIQAIQQRCDELSDSVVGLQDKMGSFRPMLKRLRVLAMSIRIESARMGSEGKGFMGLASEVEDLGQKTGTYSREVEEKIQALLQSVQAARNSMLDVERLRAEEIEPLLRHVHDLQQEMNRLHGLSEDISASVSERTQAMSRQIGEIVSSVQFHDITRQQVEHVVQVLDEVQEILCPKNDGVGQQEDQQEKVKWLGEVSNLQVRQLSATRSELAQAMQQIRESLQAIAQSIHDQDQEMARFPGLDSDREHSVLGRLEDKVSSLIASLKEARISFESIIHRLDAMAGTLQDMEGFLATVEEMGEDIELIALNASIKSAHTGSKGRPLGVLAEAIRKLAYESGELLHQVSEGLQQITSVSEHFRSSAETAGSEARKKEELSHQLESILQQLRSSNSQVATLYRSLQQGSTELLERVGSLEQDLEVQYAVERELTTVMEGLEAIESEVRGLVPERTGTPRSTRLNSILERYTMESERLVHLAFSGLEAEDGSAGDPIGEGSQVQTESDFEDNIELF